MIPVQIHGHLRNLLANAAKNLEADVSAAALTGKPPPKAPPAHLVAEAAAKAAEAKAALAAKTTTTRLNATAIQNAGFSTTGEPGGSKPPSETRSTSAARSTTSEGGARRPARTPPQDGSYKCHGCQSQKHWASRLS